MRKQIISVKDLEYSYGKENVIDGISFHVYENEIFSVMGINGSGKTTLINCLLGFFDVKVGMISLYGEDITTKQHPDLAKIFSYVPQSTASEVSLNVFDYIALGRIAHKSMFEHLNENDRSIIYDCISLLGVERLLLKNMNQISGGERQLAMIARALVQDTPIIVFDEPTSALDFSNQAIFLNTLKLLKNKGKTIIFSTHNPNHALALDSTVCLMSDRKILCCGKAREVLSQEYLNHVYGKGLKFISNENGIACTFNIC